MLALTIREVVALAEAVQEVAAAVAQVTAPLIKVAIALEVAPLVQVVL